MKNKIFSFALVISLIACLFISIPVSAKTERKKDGPYWYTVEDSKATIHQYDDDPSGELTIPSTIGGYPVTVIGEDSFSCLHNVTSITIPDTVTTISDQAFSHSNFKYISIPDSVTTIGNEAFIKCSALTGLILPENLISIGSFAFGYCNNLTNIAIPENLTTIGLNAFKECYRLANIDVDENNASFCSVDGVLFNKDKTTLYQYPCAKIGDIYHIPDSVTDIYHYAFYHSAPKIVAIPEGVTYIGHNAFGNCHNLKNIIIPGSVTTIDGWAFADSALCRIIIHEGLTTIGDYAFNDTSLSDITLPSTVTSIGSDAFWDCTGLKSITIPTGVTEIKNGTFYNCNKLKDIYYTGTENEWNAITIDDYNDPINKATIHFESIPKPTPIIGDLDDNRIIDVSDVVSMRRFVSGSYGVTVLEELADINVDGEVSVKDVIILRRYITGGYGVEL